MCRYGENELAGPEMPSFCGLICKSIWSGYFISLIFMLVLAIFIESESEVERQYEYVTVIALLTPLLLIRVIKVTSSALVILKKCQAALAEANAPRLCSVTRNGNIM